MGNTRFGNSRRALALLSGIFVALAGLTPPPTLAADVTKSDNRITWTIGDSIPAELNDETRPISLDRTLYQNGIKNGYYTLNAADGQPAAWTLDRGTDLWFYYKQSDWDERRGEISTDTQFLPGQLDRLPSTATTPILPYEAVQDGVISREDMEKVLRAMSSLTFVGSFNEYQSWDPDVSFDPDTNLMVSSLSRGEWYALKYDIPFEDFPAFWEPYMAVQMAFAHLLNPSLDFTQNADGTYSSNFPGTPGTPIPAEATVVTKGASVRFVPSREEEETPNMATIYRLYKEFLDLFENHETHNNMLDVNLDTENTQISLSDDESQYTATFVLPTDKVWDADVQDHGTYDVYRTATVAITYELYKKTASGEELVASATPGQYTDENGVTTIKMTFPVDPNTSDYVLKAKADHGLVSAVLPPNGENESASYSPVAFPANLVSAQPISISPQSMKTQARPADNGVIEADSASITVTDEITPKMFLNGTYKFVGEVREVTDGVAGEPIATATTTATLTDGTWDPAAPLIQTFTDVPVEAGKRYVVYERAYRNDEETPYSSHSDVTDNDQSFLILKRVVPTIPTSTKSTTTTATKEATVTSTTTETTTNTVTSTSWVVEPTVVTETSTINDTTTVVVPETETSTVTSTATAETTTVTTVPADSDVATETLIVNETTVVTSTTDAPMTTVPAETTTNTVTDTASTTTTVIVDGANSGSAALSAKLPWWLILIPVIPAVLGFIWNAVNQLQLPGLPAPAPAPQPCERVSFRGHNLTWGVLAGTISLIFGQNVTDHCVND